jgi:hypothetical protein
MMRRSLNYALPCTIPTVLQTVLYFLKKKCKGEMYGKRNDGYEPAEIYRRVMVLVPNASNVQNTHTNKNII